MRVGIDVGGTHTDAVLLDGDTIVAAIKRPTTDNVGDGVTDALVHILEKAQIDKASISAVMIGTTQFTNAVVERRHLSAVAAIRISLPAGRGLDPMLDWPEDLRACVGNHTYQLHGGTLYTGEPLADLIDGEIDALITDLKAKDIRYAAISAAFSPADNRVEKELANRLSTAIPGVRITRSAQFGRLGLLERENATILNAALLALADRVVDGFNQAVVGLGLTCPVFISQNDGTLMNADFVRQFPALTFASGPTNSLRGASKLTGLDNAIVVDIGGTTSDIGVLQGGFPRESNAIVSIGGARTNFRMPDILPVGIGGGSLVTDQGRTIGPKSVGYNLTSKALIFGGDTLTANDLLAAAGATDFGDAALVAELPQTTVATGLATIRRRLDDAIDMMRLSKEKMPVILVGGGALLVQGNLDSASEVLRPENAGVANAIGAAIAQIGGEAEQMISLSDTPRETAISAVKSLASDRAVKAGADRASLRLADIEETPVPYMEDNAVRIRVKMIGDVAGDITP